MSKSHKHLTDDREEVQKGPHNNKILLLATLSYLLWIISVTCQTIFEDGWIWSIVSFTFSVIVFFSLIINENIIAFGKKIDPVALSIFIPMCVMVVTSIVVGFLIPSLLTSEATLVPSGYRMYADKYNNEYVFMTDKNEIIVAYPNSTKSDKIYHAVYLPVREVVKGSKISSNYVCLNTKITKNKYHKSTLEPFLVSLYPVSSYSEHTEVRDRYVSHLKTGVSELDSYDTHDDVYIEKTDFYNNYDKLLDNNMIFMFKDDNDLKMCFADYNIDYPMYQIKNYYRVYDQKLIDNVNKHLTKIHIYEWKMR